jgi:hypothetical protein
MRKAARSARRKPVRREKIIKKKTGRALRHLVPPRKNKEPINDIKPAVYKRA